ncbi:MAG: lytic transglycosylase domain-containing protein [Bacteroidales bacterium]|nr:lytic transglycosylase domain-containing protein [Bacteroidales bacterium]
MKKLCITAIILSAVAIAGEVLIFATKNEPPDTTHEKAIRSTYRVYAPVLPDSIDFAGEPIPLDVYYVREALDRELTSMIYFQSNSIMWFKRAGRMFPTIERILRDEGVPEDFKYLCVIESGMQNLTSPAKAQGYWQFLKSTGQNYGLEISEEVDMRNDLEASTRAACRFLKDLRAHLGSWTDAAAAYNRGEAGLAAAIRRQGSTGYYDTKLNNETSRYVYRIVAAKILMQSPQRYGYYIRQCDIYRPVPVRQVALKGQNVDLCAFARNNGTSYKALRDLNPWLCTDKLVNRSNKSYTVNLPAQDNNKTHHSSTGNTLITRM